MASDHPFQMLFETFGRLPTAHAESVNKKAFEQLTDVLSVPVEKAGRCILLRAPRAGHGKTHLLSRVQNRLGNTHEFIPLQAASGFRIDAPSVIDDTLRRLVRALPASGGLSVLDLVTRRLFSHALQPLVKSGEVPCQDREGALAALQNKPVETFDFHHPNAVTAHWARENFEVLGPRLSLELSQRSDLPLREVSFWVNALFRFASTPLEDPTRARVLSETVFIQTPVESDGDSMERLSALLGLLTSLMRVVLVADDLEGFSADETAALRFAAFLGSLRQSAERLDVILSLNQDIWKSAFVPRLSGGLADRLSEVVIELEPLKEEEMIALLESRVPGMGREILDKIHIADAGTHSRGLIRAAAVTWDSPSAFPPPVPVVMPVFAPPVKPVAPVAPPEPVALPKPIAPAAEIEEIAPPAPTPEPIPAPAAEEVAAPAFTPPPAPAPVKEAAPAFILPAHSVFAQAVETAPAFIPSSPVFAAPAEPEQKAPEAPAFEPAFTRTAIPQPRPVFVAPPEPEPVQPEAPAFEPAFTRAEIPQTRPVFVSPPEPELVQVSVVPQPKPIRLEPEEPEFRPFTTPPEPPTIEVAGEEVEPESTWPAPAFTVPADNPFARFDARENPAPVFHFGKPAASIPPARPAQPVAPAPVFQSPFQMEPTEAAAPAFQPAVQPAQPAAQPVPAAPVFQNPFQSTPSEPVSAPVFQAPPEPAQPAAQPQQAFTAPAISPFQAAPAPEAPAFVPASIVQEPAPAAVASPYGNGQAAAFQPATPAPAQAPAAEAAAVPAADTDRVDELLRQFRERYGRGGL